jgi:hypothetical protein
MKCLLAAAILTWIVGGGPVTFIVLLIVFALLLGG